MMTPPRDQRLPGGESCGKGFSLLELLVAMTVFLLISSVSFTLFTRHQALLSQEQLTVGLNVGLRNALSQIQLDVVNAGNGLILGTNVPAWPVGVTIINSNPSPEQCYQAATFNAAGALISLPVYNAACFDQMNVIVADPNTPAIHPCVLIGCTISTSAGTTAYGLTPSVIDPATGVNFTAAQLASQFKAGDPVLFVQSCAGGGHANGSSGCAFTTAILSSAGGTTTSPPGCGATCVTLSFGSTLAGGGNPVANDPYQMTVNAPAAELTDQFGPNDWVVRLLPITYTVNANHTDSQNQPDPQLVRTQGNPPSQNILMDQVIAFKVGAALWNNSNTSTFLYNYNAQSYTTGSNPPGTNANQFNLIRSVRVSIIGRTEPNAANPYRNAFDQGPYEIRGNSVIVDPRNLTMNSD
jgi:prepilin-type N-terminal cleavage/methylation domain-containing protein